MNQLGLVTWRLPHARIDQLEQAKSTLEAHEGDRWFLLTTCQRALASTCSPHPHEALDEMLETTGLAGGERFTGHSALRHLARVASGLDALVPGEDQAPAQFRDALDDQRKHLPRTLQTRLDRARSIARQARDAGELTGHTSRSLIDLVHPLIPETGPFAILGTGTIAKRAIQTLAPDHEIHVASRTLPRAHDASPTSATPWTREGLLHDPPPLRGVLLCTTTEDDQPLLTPDTAGTLLDRAHGDDPLHVVDLGLPRTADPDLRHDPRIRLTTLDEIAREATATPSSDPLIRTAKNAISKALERERRHRLQATREARIKALRRDLKDTLQRLDLDSLSQKGQGDWIHEAYGKIAHTSQKHLEATLQGEPPP